MAGKSNDRPNGVGEKELIWNAYILSKNLTPDDLYNHLLVTQLSRSIDKVTGGGGVFKLVFKYSESSESILDSLSKRFGEQVVILPKKCFKSVKMELRREWIQQMKCHKIELDKIRVDTGTTIVVHGSDAWIESDNLDSLQKASDQLESALKEAIANDSGATGFAKYNGDCAVDKKQSEENAAKDLCRSNGDYAEDAMQTEEKAAKDLTKSNEACAIDTKQLNEKAMTDLAKLNGGSTVDAKKSKEKEEVVTDFTTANGGSTVRMKPSKEGAITDCTKVNGVSAVSMKPKKEETNVEFTEPNGDSTVNKELSKKKKVPTATLR